MEETHRIKKISHNRDILYVGERLPLATEQERKAMLDEALKKIEKQACAAKVPNQNDALQPPHNPNDKYNLYGDPAGPTFDFSKLTFRQGCAATAPGIP